MGRKAKPQSLQRQDYSILKEEWTLKAMEWYWADQCIPEHEKKKSRGVRVCCREAEDQCYEETNQKVKISPCTLLRRVNGGRSIRDFNAEKRWLTVVEEKVVSDNVIEVANRGFPLNHKRLKEHVDKIASARYGLVGDAPRGFPESGVGECWTGRFIERHPELRAYWSRGLDHSRARAVNPATKEAFFSLYATTVEGNGGDDVIPPELIWGADESGFQEGIGGKERVFGPQGKTVQHQQRGGDRENITVMVVICADGTTMPPAVIFKGESFQTTWRQNNPLNASLGYSHKGYINGEIGVEWIKGFDKAGKAKAEGRRHLLVVDGHNSHYTLGFLEYARENRIHVLCYPSHSTHVYQGLDVVVFGVLKRRWWEARDAYERRTGRRVDKSNFLEVYAEAHKKTLTKGIIKAAFRKTGLVPFDPGIITDEMMAPSLESSSRGTLPVAQSSPIRVITKTIQSELARRASGTFESPHDNNENRGYVPQIDPALTALDGLATTSAAWLVSPSPITSTLKPPTFKTSAVSPIKQYRHYDLLSEAPSTHQAKKFQDALRESESWDAARKELVIELQAASVLNTIYIGRAQSQLQAKEKAKSKGKSKRLMGDGMPHLLDGDEFFERVVRFEAAQQQGAKEREAKRIRKGKHSEVIAEWKKADKVRREQNKVVKEQWLEAVQQWELERDATKREGGRLPRKKPTLKEFGGQEKLVPRPKLAGKDASDESSSESGGDDEEHL